MRLRFWLTVALGALAALLMRALGLAPDEAPEALGAFVTLIIQGVTAAFKWLAERAVTVATVVWHATRIVGSAIARFAIGLGGVLSKVYELFGQFWRSVLRPLIHWTWRQVDRLHGWLRGTLGPAIHFLEELRRRVLAIYERYLRPVFDAIELTRRVLQILAAFHVKWARELDAKLAELEDRLLYPLRAAIQKINEAIYWLDRVVTLDGLIQRITLIRSLVRDQRLMWNLWWNASASPLTAAERARLLERAEAYRPGEELAKLPTAERGMARDLEARVERFSAMVDRARLS